MDDFNFNDIDWNDELSFFRAIGAGKPGGLPMPTLVSPDEVRREAKQRVANIFSDHWRLRSILERHELTIQRRWLKKNREQRRRVFLTLWPDMSPSHRLNFEAFTKESEQQRESGTKF